MEKINKTTILKRIQHLDKYLELLENYKKTPMKLFLTDETLQLSTQRALEICITVCIDIGAHITSLITKEESETYSAIFSIMEEKKIISEDMMKRMIEMVKFRNFLTHIYMSVDDEKIYAILQNDLKDFYEFRNIIIEKYLKGT